MVIIALDGGGGLLEADVVETSKGGATDVLDGVIRDQELLLGEAGTDGIRKFLRKKPKKKQQQRTFHLMKI